MASQQQVRAAITGQIIAALESGGVPPWRRPWRVGPNAGFPANVVSKKSYPVVSPKNYTPGLSIRSVSVPPAPYDGS
jgi:hypothetical protein